MHWHDIARTQHGVIDRFQLADCGVTDAAVRGLVLRREIRRVLPGVFIHASGNVGFLSRAWAATLWSGGVLSHATAARLWQMPGDATTTIHVTVGDRDFRRSQRGICVHRVPIDELEINRGDGPPRTSRPRTVIDLLRTERSNAARNLLDRALMQGWVSIGNVESSIRDGTGRTGNVQLRQLLADLEPGAQAESERLLHRLLKSAALAGWVPQYRVRVGGRTRYIDVAFPDARLAIEVDGRLAHDVGSDRFEDDRERQNDLVAAGWRVLRFTWNQLKHRPDWVLAQIAQQLVA